MKIEFKMPPPQKKEVPTFPLFAKVRYPDNCEPNIVLFFSEHQGIVVDSIGSNFPKGRIYDMFASCFTSSDWEIIPGSATFTS